MQFFKQNYIKYTDEELMDKAADGNNNAFEEIYNRYSAKLLGYFKRMLWRDNELAEDCLHKLFLKIIEKPELFDSTRSFKTWIYSAAHNICKNEYRRMETHPNINTTQHPIIGEEALPPNQERSVDNSKFLKDLEAELEGISEKHSHTFKLRYFEHLNLKEIAEIMECSEGTVKSRLYYALKALADKLKPYKTLLQK